MFENQEMPSERIIDRKNIPSMAQTFLLNKAHSFDQPLGSNQVVRGDIFAQSIQEELEIKRESFEDSEFQIADSEADENSPRHKGNVQSAMLLRNGSSTL